MKFSKPSNSELAVAIIDFLQTTINEGSLSEHSDSLQVAIECISDAFGVSLSDKTASDSLVSIFNEYKLKSKASLQTVSGEDKLAAESLKLEGNRCMAAKSYDAAVDLYSQAILKSPLDPALFSNRAAAHSALQNFSVAIQDAETALLMDPHYSKAYARLGLAHYLSGNAEASFAAYQKGLELEDGSPTSSMMKGFQASKSLLLEQQNTQSVSSDDEGSTSTPEPETVNTFRENNSLRDFSDSTTKDFKSEAFPSLSSNSSQSNAPPKVSASSFPDIGSFMNNPHLVNMAQSLVSNPSMLSGLLHDPHLQRMVTNIQKNGMPSMADVLSNPSLQKLAKNMVHGKSEASTTFSDEGSMQGE